MKLLQLIFLFIFVYLIYKAVRFFISLAGQGRDMRNRMNEEQDKRQPGEKGKIIELDKDQYKVD